LIEGIAAFVGWVGAAVIVLSHGRRGLALGLALLTLALAALALLEGEVAGAAALFVGGAIASIRRLAAGADEGWGLMPAGSTPRLLLCVAVALVALWFASSVTLGPGGPLRFIALSAIGLTAARALERADKAVALTAVAGLALAVAAATALSAGALGPVPYILGALIAAGVTFLPQPEPHAA
jgi:hypothetical protein